MDDTARQQAFEMAETTDRTLAATFGWATHEERLYRDCPTAFWLAPDGDGVLLPPPAGPMPPAPIAIAAQPAEADTIAVEGLATGVCRAIVAAGPTFAATAMLLFRAETDRAWWEPIGRALVSLTIFPLTILFGAMLAVLPVLTGVAALGFARKTFETLRGPGAWMVTGGVMGAAIATLFDAGGAGGLALIATAIACAAIARTAVDWTAAGPA